MRVTIQPENKTIHVSRVSTVLGLLNRLGLRTTQALTIRDNQLLTPDRKVSPDDQIIVRKVVSKG